MPRKTSPDAFYDMISTDLKQFSNLNSSFIQRINCHGWLQIGGILDQTGKICLMPL